MEPQTAREHIAVAGELNSGECEIRAQMLITFEWSVILDLSGSKSEQQNRGPMLARLFTLEE